MVLIKFPRNLLECINFVREDEELIIKDRMIVIINGLLFDIVKRIWYNIIVS